MLCKQALLTQLELRAAASFDAYRLSTLHHRLSALQCSHAAVTLSQNCKTDSHREHGLYDVLGSNSKHLGFEHSDAKQ